LTFGGRYSKKKGETVVLCSERVNMAVVLISGYAKLPSHITSSKLYETLVVVVTVEMDTGVIKEADCSLSTGLSRRFVAQLIDGYSLEDGIGKLVRKFDTRFYGSTRKAIITALKTIYEKYSEAKGDRADRAKGDLARSTGGLP
jgi:hypothetical protein